MSRASRSTELPPFSQPAEESVVGACLLGGAPTTDLAASIVTPDQFYLRSLGSIFSACVDVAATGSNPDPVTVGDALRRSGEISDVGDVGRLIELMSSTSAVSNIEHHAAIVAELAYAREQFFVGQKLISYAGNGGLTMHPEMVERIGRMLAPRTGGRALEALDLSEMLSGPIPQISWLWRNWVALNDLVMVIGDPGVGKSYLCLALALAVRAGAVFLGSETHKGRVGIIDVENPRADVHVRLHALGLRADNTEGMSYIHMPTLTIARPEGLAALDATVQLYDLDVLVLDSFRRLAPGIDENDSAAVSAILTPLRKICHDHSVTMLIIHHARKRGEGPTDAGQMTRGSGEFMAAPDTQIFLRSKAGDAGAFTLEHGKNRHGIEHPAIAVRIVSDEDGNATIEYEGDVVTTDDRVEQILERITKTLAARARFTARKELRIEIGLSTDQLDTKIMSRALKLGVQRDVLVERKAGGSKEYVLTSDNLALDAPTDDDVPEFPF